MTEAIYLEVTEKAEAAHKAGRRVSVSGVLKILGVSRSGFLAFLRRKPTASQLLKDEIKDKILDIYNQSKQNYGAPKITRELQKSGCRISERTVGKYMQEMGIKAQWAKHWTKPLRILILALNSTTSLMNSSTQIDRMLYGVLISLISGPSMVLFILQASWICMPVKSLHGLFPQQWKFPV